MLEHPSNKFISHALNKFQTPTPCHLISDQSFCAEMATAALSSLLSLLHLSLIDTRFRFLITSSTFSWRCLMNLEEL